MYRQNQVKQILFSQQDSPSDVTMDVDKNVSTVNTDVVSGTETDTDSGDVNLEVDLEKVTGSIDQIADYMIGPRRKAAGFSVKGVWISLESVLLAAVIIVLIALTIVTSRK